MVEKVNTSESTIRRDLNKVINTKQDKVMVRKNLNIDEKLEIAKYAFGGLSS